MKKKWVKKACFFLFLMDLVRYFEFSCQEFMRFFRFSCSFVSKCYFGFLIFFTAFSSSGTHIYYNDSSQVLAFGKGVELLEDASGKMKVEDVLRSTEFIPSTSNIVNRGITSSAFWIKFKVTNQASEPILLQIPYPLLDQVTLYSFIGNKRSSVTAGISADNREKVHDHPDEVYDHPNFIFELNLKKNETGYYLLRVQSDISVFLPLEIGTFKMIAEKDAQKDMVFGAYFGVIAIMLLYNLFLLFTIHDSNYFRYILSILFVGLEQMGMEGYLVMPVSDLLSVSPKLYLFTVMVFQGITGICFFKNISEIRSLSPAVSKGMNFSVYILFSVFVLALFQFYHLSFMILNIASLAIGIFLLVVLILVCKKDRNTGIIFLAAYSMYLLGMILSVMRNMEILPYNLITNQLMPAGSVAELFIISIALGYRINLLKRDNFRKQKEIFKHQRKNEIYLKKSQENLLKAEKLQKEKALSEFEALKNQVNPHFLFNSLNVLAELVNENQKMAVDFIEELSGVYRYVLESRHKNFISFQEELEFIKSYVYLLNIRYNNNLHMRYEVLDSDKAYIPPLSLQVVVENAIKHNVISDQYPLTIELVSDKEFLVVTNSIRKKINIEKNTGIGLNNISARVEFLTSQKLIVESDEQIFRVKIPLLKREI